MAHLTLWRAAGPFNVNQGDDGDGRLDRTTAIPPAPDGLRAKGDGRERSWVIVIEMPARPRRAC